MPWLPDHIWFAQKGLNKGKGKSNYGGDTNQMAAMLALQLMEQMGQLGGNAGGGKKRKAGGALALAPPQKQAAVAPSSWKQVLNEAFTKKHKGVVKGQILYTTEGDGPYSSIVMSEQFSTGYSGEGASKKEAENAAALAAIQGEFPEAAKKSKKKQGGAVAAPVMSQKAVKIASMANSIAKAVGWKSRLMSALSKKLEASVSKEDLAFETVKQGEGNTGFVSTLTSPHFSKVYASGKQSSKSKAEDTAAKNAFVGEFGAVFHALPDDVKKTKAAGPTPGQKKELVLEPKQELVRGLCLFLGRPTTKEDMEVTYPEVGGQITPTLTIKIDGKSQTYKGTPYAKTDTREEKRKAETVAVNAALAKNRGSFKTGLAMAEAKKEQKKLEFKVRLEKLKEEAAQAKAVKKELTK